MVVSDSSGLGYNALSAPGRLIMTNKLLNLCRTDDELAIVLGQNWLTTPITTWFAKWDSIRRGFCSGHRHLSAAAPLLVAARPLPKLSEDVRRFPRAMSQCLQPPGRT